MKYLEVRGFEPLVNANLAPAWVTSRSVGSNRLDTQNPTLKTQNSILHRRCVLRDLVVDTRRHQFYFLVIVEIADVGDAL